MQELRGGGGGNLQALSVFHVQKCLKKLMSLLNSLLQNVNNL